MMIQILKLPAKKSKKTPSFCTKQKNEKVFKKLHLCYLQLAQSTEFLYPTKLRADEK